MNGNVTSITGLKQTRAEHLDDIEELLDKAKAEGRDLNAAEQRKVNGLMEKVDVIDKTELPRLERLYDMKNSRMPSTSRIAPPPLVPLDSNYDTQIVGLPRHQPVKNFRGIVNGKPPAERAYEFGHWMLAQISRHCPAQAGHFEQSAELCRERGILNVAQTNVNSDAGYLVPEQFGQDLVYLREKYSKLRQVAEIVPMDSDVRTDPKWTSGLTAFFTGESAAGTESDAAWENLTLTAKKLMVITRMSAELSADAAINYGDVLVREIAFAFALKEDQVGFGGTGISTDGGIIGVRTKLQDVDAAGTDSFGLNTQGTGTTWGAIVIGDFHDTVALCPEYSLEREPRWICSTTFFHEVMTPLAIAQAGGATPPQVGDQTTGASFLGFPVVFSQTYPSATATSSVVTTFGSHDMGIRLGDRQQESIMFSEHASVGGQSVYERNQIAIRGTERLDIVVHGVGNSAATEAGPIVGLQTGS